MGTEYDIRCLDCEVDAGVGAGCSKNSEAMNEAIRIRETMEGWAERGIDIALSAGHSSEISPDFFLRHRGHRLAVVGDNGTDYTDPARVDAELETLREKLRLAEQSRDMQRTIAEDLERQLALSRAAWDAKPFFSGPAWQLMATAPKDRTPVPDGDAMREFPRDLTPQERHDTRLEARRALDREGHMRPGVVVMMKQESAPPWSANRPTCDFGILAYRVEFKIARATCPVHPRLVTILHLDEKIDGNPCPLCWSEVAYVPVASKPAPTPPPGPGRPVCGP